MKTKGIEKKIDEKKKVKIIDQMNDETKNKGKKKKGPPIDHVEVRNAP